MGTTGKMFSIEHFGIAPDIMALGKALGFGFPLAAVLTQSKTVEDLRNACMHPRSPQIIYIDMIHTCPLGGTSTRISSSVCVCFFLISVLLVLTIFPVLNTTAQKYGGTAICTWGPVGGPTTLNPDIAFDIYAARIGGQIYNTLVRFNAITWEIIPQLAYRWEVSPDAKEYTFYLVENATWHDGEKFTSADVKFTFETVLAEQGPAYRKVESIERIETPDDYTVKFYLSRSDAVFLSSLARPTSYTEILPKHIYEGTDWTENEANWNPIGTGPFKFVEWVRGDHITLEANEDYFRGRPRLDKIIIKLGVPSPTAIAGLEAGEISFIYYSGDMPTAEFVRLQEKDEFFGAAIPFPIVIYLGFNLNRPPYNNTLVRRAIALAINRTDVVQKAFYGRLESEDSYYCSLVSWAVNPDVRQPDCDPAMAEELLDDAGYPRGPDGTRFKMNIAYIPSMLIPDMMEVVKEHLKEVGIDPVLNLMDMATWAEKVVQQHDFDVTSGGGFHGPDPDDYGDHIHSEGYRNYYGYSNPRVDELFDLGRSVFDRDERKEYYYEIQEIMSEDVVRVSIYVAGYYIISSVDYHGFWWEQPYGLETTMDFYDLVWWEGGTEPAKTIFGIPYGVFTAIVATVVVVAIIVSAVYIYIRRRKR